MPCLQIRPHTDHRSTDSRATFARRASPKPPSAPQRTLLRFGMQNRQPKRPADVPHLQIQSRDDYYRQIRMPHLQRQSHDDHHMEATRVAIAIPTSPQPAKPGILNWSGFCSAFIVRRLVSPGSYSTRFRPARVSCSPGWRGGVSSSTMRPIGTSPAPGRPRPGTACAARPARSCTRR